MKHAKNRKHFFAVIAAVLVPVTILWSWNVVADLFGGPTAELKHLVAAALILAFVRCTLFPRRHNQAGRANEH